MPPPIPDDKRAELSNLIFQRRKIEAIKLYRELTNFGLKEAKDEVEALELTLRKQSPEKFTAAPKGKGCFGVAAVLCLFVIGGGYWLVLR